MRTVSLLVGVALIVLGASVATAGERPTREDTSQPAVWAPHDLIVDLRNLPKRYTCDDLWYKFRAVLLAIGARPDLKILPYRCEPRAGSAAFSPKVHLRFSTARTVSGTDTRWADVRAGSRLVHLQPGTPDRIDDQDCELLSQMKATLLRYLDDHVVEFNLACQALRRANPPFGMTVSALVPVTNSPPDVANVSHADEAGPLRSGS